MKKKVIATSSKDSVFEVSGDSLSSTIALRSTKKDWTRSEMPRMKIVALNRLAQKSVKFRSGKLFLNVDINRIEINPTVNHNHFKVIQNFHEGEVREVICVFEIKREKSLRRKRFLNLRDSVRSENISNALSDLYKAESIEINEFAEAIQNIHKVKGLIPQRIAKLQQ